MDCDGVISLSFYRSYGEVLEDWPTLLNWTLPPGGESYMPKGLMATCDELLIEIRVLEANASAVKVNVTLILVDGVAKLGKRYPRRPRVDAGWIDRGAFYVARFGRMEISEVAVVDRVSGEITSLHGVGCCDWPFWLGQADMGREGYAMLLYSLDGVTNVTSAAHALNMSLAGIAQVVTLDVSKAAPRNFSAEGVRVKGEEQIYMDRGVLPGLVYVVNVGRDEARELIELIRRRMPGELYGAKPVQRLLLEYHEDERKLVVWENVFDKVDLGGKAWRLLLRRSYAGSHTAYPGGERVIRLRPVIEYRGKLYEAWGCFLKEVAYCRRLGILLYIRLACGDVIDRAFPSAVTRLFNITPYSSIDGGEIAITLVKAELKGMPTPGCHSTSAEETRSTPATSPVTTVGREAERPKLSCLVRQGPNTSEEIVNALGSATNCVPAST